MASWDKDVVLMVLNGIMVIGGFIISFLLARLIDTIKQLEAKDQELDRKITLHREDVLKNYATETSLATVKIDIIDRIDRFEKTIVAIIGRK